MKQKITYLLCCCLAVSRLLVITACAEPPPAWPSNTGVFAEAGAVIDADSGALLYGQNSINTAFPPASITKLLTALIVLEHCQLDEVVTFSQVAMNSVEADSGNKLSLVAGDQMTVEDCLYSLLLISVNQSANALAEHVAGSIPAFVDMMNEKAAQLGCSDKTHFENPSGLNGDTQKVTAYDMAMISRAAFNNEDLLRISSSLNHKIPATINNPDGITIRQEHRLLYTTDPDSEFYYPPAKAGKTGYLIKAGNTLVTYAEQDGRRLISVVLKGKRPQYFVDGKTLLEFGFSHFKNVAISDYESRYVTGEDSVNINGVSYRPSDLMIEPGQMITLPKDASFEDAAMSLETPGSDSPANAVAVLRYSYNDRFIGKAHLMTIAMDSDLEVNISSSETADGQPGSSGSDQADGSKGLPFSLHLPPAVTIAVGIAAAAAAVLCICVMWFLYSRKKEARELAARREARRRRLQASGQEEEFKRLMEMRKARDSLPRFMEEDNMYETDE